jgi:hypothetical protein
MHLYARWPADRASRGRLRLVPASRYVLQACVVFGTVQKMKRYRLCVCLYCTSSRQGVLQELTNMRLQDLRRGHVYRGLALFGSYLAFVGMAFNHCFPFA